MSPVTPTRTDIIAIFLIAIFASWGLYLIVTGNDRVGLSESDPVKLVERAKDLENSGKIQESLKFYRRAISINPALCDPMSVEFLGKGFEGRLNIWIKKLKMKEMKNRDGALENAAFIFRKLNGGCG